MKADVTPFPASPAAPARSSSIWLNPYLMILVSALLDTFGEVLLSKGSRLAGATSAIHGPLGFLAPITSIWTWGGIICYVSSLLSWLYVLKSVPLSIAFPLINVVQVLVPVGAHVFLHEQIPPRLWLGVTLVVMGLMVIARPLMKAEEKL